MTGISLEVMGLIIGCPSQQAVEQCKVDNLLKRNKLPASVHTEELFTVCDPSPVQNVLTDLDGCRGIPLTMTPVTATDHPVSGKLMFFYLCQAWKTHWHCSVELVVSG